MNEAQEEIQLLGFLGMCAKSMKIISSRKKIFFQISITLILPLLVIFLFHKRVSMVIDKRIIPDFNGLDRISEISFFDKIFNALSIEDTQYWVNEIVYLIILATLSLLSISVVVYTVAGVCSDNQITYKMIMSFVPNVWNRLLITSLYNLVIFIIYNIFACLTLSILHSLYLENGMKLTKIALSAIYTLYLIGFVYICVIWQLASVISVLEDIYGFEAIAKSKTLIKGKMGISAAIFLELNISLGCIHLLFDKFLVFEDSIGLIWEVVLGSFALVLRYLFFLFGLAVQTIIYFVHESSIYNSTLNAHPNEYLGSYVRLKSEDVRNEQV